MILLKQFQESTKEVIYSPKLNIFRSIYLGALTVLFLVILSGYLLFSNKSRSMIASEWCSNKKVISIGERSIATCTTIQPEVLTYSLISCQGTIISEGEEEKALKIHQVELTNDTCFVIWRIKSKSQAPVIRYKVK